MAIVGFRLNGSERFQGKHAKRLPRRSRLSGRRSRRTANALTAITGSMTRAANWVDRDNASIPGAMVSGRRATEAVLGDRA